MYKFNTISKRRGFSSHFNQSGILTSSLSFPKFFLFLFFFTASVSSFGRATMFWDGSTGNWNDASKWSGGVVPGQGDVASIQGGTCTIQLSTSTPNLKKVSIKNSNTKLIVNGTLNTFEFGSVTIGIKMESGALIENNGTINISSEKDGLHMIGENTSFTNNGLLDIKDTNKRGIYMASGGPVFTNNAGKTVKIGSLAAVANEGIRIRNDAIFNNFGIVQIINVGINNKLKLENYAKFNNESGSILEVFGDGNIKLTGNDVTFKCEGTIEPGGIGTIGTLTIDSDVDFSKVTVNAEIAASGSVDQIIVGGSGATLGGTSVLNVITTNSYQIMVGDEFSILTATNLGTFATENLSGCCAWAVEYVPALKITALTALPVELISFRGNLQDENTLLSWETASELNNSGFEIERSLEGEKWEMIGFVSGNLTTNNINSYHFRDMSPASGINYYRLKQIDLNGAFEYSNTIVLEVENKNQHEILVYPSPASEQINIHSSIFTAQKTNLKIVNSVGQIILEELIPANEDRIIKTIDISKYEKGIYFVIVSNGRKYFSSNFIVVH